MELNHGGHHFSLASERTTFNQQNLRLARNIAENVVGILSSERDQRHEMG